LSRNAKRRGLPQKPEQGGNAVPPAPEFSFIAPTEMVSLPSEGKLYPNEHHLHNVLQLEIKFMTAKEEDLLLNENYIKNGIVIDKLLRSLLVDKSINPDDLLVADRNALIIAARISAYGNEYNTKITCPRCNTSSEQSFDLLEHEIHFDESLDDVEKTENCTFLLTVPLSNFQIEIRPLTGIDEKYFAALFRKTSKKKGRFITEQLKRIILSVDAETNPDYIQAFVNNIPARDSLYVRSTLKRISPTIKVEQEFACPNCNFEEVMEVPFNTEFFWPDQ